jgi:DnaJ-class molecular chaperone
MNVLRALLGAREQTESQDDEVEGDDDAAASKARQARRKLLKMRCYACAGSGRIELLENGARIGRLVRCIACGGTGKIVMG